MIAIADAFSGSMDRKALIEGNPAIARMAQGQLATNRIEIAQKRHRGKLNVTFADGHVEANKVQALYFDETDHAIRRWNRDHEPHRSHEQ